MSDLRIRNKWICLLRRILTLELNIINNDQPFLNDKTEQVEKLLVRPDLLHNWLVLLHALMAEGLDGIRLGYVLEKNLEDV